MASRPDCARRRCRRRPLRTFPARAASFWRHNWHISPCLPEEDRTHDQANEDENASPPAASSGPTRGCSSADDEGDAHETTAELDSLTEELINLFNDFLERLLDPNSYVDLYSPARHEVIGGLLSRAARSALATVRAPHQWSGEHGSHLTRLLVETKIVLEWLDLKGPGAYLRYQAYGVGKRKAMAMRMNEIASDFPTKPPTLLADALEDFRKKLATLGGEHFIEVSLESTFSGVSLRQMAIDVGQKDLYDNVYQSSSGVAHGEWWAVEDYSMQRCLNPLHRFHQIPSFAPSFPTTPGLGRYWVDSLRELLALGLRQLGLERSANIPAATAPP